VRRSKLRTVYGLFTRDLGWKLLSLAIAVLLWFFVASEPELSTFVTVPVQFKDMPEGVEVASDIVESVYLELRGPSVDLRALEANRTYAVVLDMSQVGPGERTFAIGPADVRLPRGLRMERAFPSELRFTFEKRTTAQVPVEVRFTTPHPGYELAGFQVSPSVLGIVGPESRVNRVKSVATDSIDLSGVVGAAQFHVNAFVEDGHVRLVSPPRVTVDVQVKARPEPAPRRTT
jgi:YbbR domain-containing protein